MTLSNSSHESEIFGEEDNSPFPPTQIGVTPSVSHTNGKKQQSTGPENTHAQTISLEVRESSLLQSLNAPDLPPADKDQGSDNDDQESLFLFTSERENFNAVNINHESRVVQMLSSDSPVEVQISEAGNSNEGMANSLKKYIVYTMKLKQTNGAKEEIQTRRRYSDFESLRDFLNRIFPLVIIPPIPPKNYLALNVWNGLVGNSGHGYLLGYQDPSHQENNSLGGLNAYSYINSKHLNKGRLIEHRKRLLANFLNNCLRIKRIRNLTFFAKFLDPTANWSDEVALIQSQLPKLIYQLNPENGLKTEEIYSELPLPVSSNALGISLLKANKFAQKTSQLFGSATSDIVNAATPFRPERSDGDEANTENAGLADGQVLSLSQLDNFNKRIMTNLIALSNDYVELGVALNLMSLGVCEPTKSKISKDTDLEDNTKLDFTFDKVGMAFDRSYLTLNSLMSELEMKFSEPLGEAVQYTSILNSVEKFQEKKIKQKHRIEHELREKRKELTEKMRLEIEASNLNNEEQQHKTQREPKSRGGFISTMTSFKKITDYVSTIIDQTPELTRRERIAQLQKRITVQEKCQAIMMEDIAYVTCEVDKNHVAFKQKELAWIYLILRSYNSAFVLWAKKNLEIWEEIKEEIVKTEF